MENYAGLFQVQDEARNDIYPILCDQTQKVSEFSGVLGYLPHCKSKENHRDSITEKENQDEAPIRVLEYFRRLEKIISFEI